MAKTVVEAPGISVAEIEKKLRELESPGATVLLY